MKSHLKTLALVFTLSTAVGFGGMALTSSACVHAPASLSPVGQRAFDNTRVIQSLDLLRDFAISANAQVPPVLSTATTRKVVRYHESAVKIIAAIPNGWKSGVSVGLDEMMKDLPAAEAQAVAPYVALVRGLLMEWH